jgi:hypothetical protein
MVVTVGGCGFAVDVCRGRGRRRRRGMANAEVQHRGWRECGWGTGEGGRGNRSLGFRENGWTDEVTWKDGRIDLF